MNERIKELAEQAENYAAEQNDKFGVSYKKEYNQKFAELIVKECVENLKQTKSVELPFLQAVNNTVSELPLSVYISELKKHFGVKE